MFCGDERKESRREVRGRWSGRGGSRAVWKAEWKGVGSWVVVITGVEGWGVSAEGASWWAKAEEGRGEDEGVTRWSWSAGVVRRVGWGANGGGGVSCRRGVRHALWRLFITSPQRHKLETSLHRHPLDSLPSTCDGVSTAASPTTYRTFAHVYISIDSTLVYELHILPSRWMSVDTERLGETSRSLH